MCLVPDKEIGCADKGFPAFQDVTAVELSVKEV